MDWTTDVCPECGSECECVRGTGLTSSGRGNPGPTGKDRGRRTPPWPQATGNWNRTETSLSTFWSGDPSFREQEGLGPDVVNTGAGRVTGTDCRPSGQVEVHCPGLGPRVGSS